MNGVSQYIKTNKPYQILVNGTNHIITLNTILL